MWKIKRKLREIYTGLRIQIRVIRLHFMHVPEPADAKTAEQMAKEIKEASKLT